MKKYKTLFLTFVTIFLGCIYVYTQASISEENNLAVMSLVAFVGLIVSLAGMITLSVLEIRADKKNDKKEESS